jgi:hypothetical protein
MISHHYEDGPVACVYCERMIRLAFAESCWFCNGALCFACWQDVGHCGHFEAFQRNRKMVHGDSHA